MKKLIWSGAALAAVLMMASQAEAVTATGSVSVNASVNAKAKLTIGGGPVNFPDADPDDPPREGLGEPLRDESPKRWLQEFGTLAMVKVPLYSGSVALKTVTVHPAE